MDNVVYEHLNEEQQTVVDIVGIDKFIALVDELGGTSIYFPKSETVNFHLRNKGIIEDYLSGATYRQLAKKYKMTYQNVYYIVTEARKRK